MKRKHRSLPLIAGMVIALAVMIFYGGMVLASEGDFAGGKGTALDPYRIASAEQLDNVRKYLGDSYRNKFFKLTADIDLSAYDDVWPDGSTGWVPIGTSGQPFTGIFDGNGHTITGLNTLGYNFVGLFGYIDGASIMNFRLEEVDVAGYEYVGGLVGYNDKGTIESSFTSGKVRGNNGRAGGLAGINIGGIYDSHSVAKVTGGDKMVGGLVGDNRIYGTIGSSYASGDVTGLYGVGGLVGENLGGISDSYATGAVTGSSEVGGLVGFHGGLISNSYATGAVTGNSNVGGLIGWKNLVTVTHSCFNSDTTGQSDTGKGDPKSTREMKQEETFTGWDFNNTWQIAAGTYPYLKWQAESKDLAAPVFALGYPQAVNIINNSLDLQIKTDEDAAVYLVVLEDGEAKPSAAQVRAGTDSDDGMLADNLKGIITLSAGTVGTVSISSLVQEAAYDIYVTAEDPAGNLQPDVCVAMVEVETTLVPTANITFGLITPDTSITGNSLEVNQSYPKGVLINTVNGTDTVVITCEITENQNVAVSGSDAGKVTASGGETNPNYIVDTSEIADGGGTCEFILTISEDERADIVYPVTVTIAPPDITPPVAGNGGSILISQITHNSMNLSWTAAADDRTIEKNMQYKAVYSENDNINTVEEAEENGTLVKDWTANLTSTKADSLSAETAYYFNIIVRDEAGNKAVYNMTSQTTAAAPSGGGSGGGGGGGPANLPAGGTFEITPDQINSLLRKNQALELNSDQLRISLSPAALSSLQGGGDIMVQTSLTTDPATLNTFFIAYPGQKGIMKSYNISFTWENNGQTENITELDGEITLTFELSAEDLEGIDPSTLIIFKQGEDGSITELSGEFDWATNSVSITTSHLCEFYIMGKEGIPTQRLAGENRYATAVAISQAGWQTSDNVILVSGENFPDALTGTVLAGILKAPVLLTNAENLSKEAMAEIKRLEAKNIYILGGTAVISETIEDALSKDYTVKRISGLSRYGTALNIGQLIYELDETTAALDTVILTTGENYPDALSIAPFAGRYGYPILFTERDSLNTYTSQALYTWGIKNVIIAGGPGAVSLQVEDYLQNELGLNVTRLGGKDRYLTGLEIVKHFENYPEEISGTGKYKEAALATGENFPDALTGAAHAAGLNLPVILTGKDRISPEIKDYLHRLDLDKIYIYGGEGAIAEKVKEGISVKK